MFAHVGAPPEAVIRRDVATTVIENHEPSGSHGGTAR